MFADYFISSNQILIFIKDFGDTSQNVICEIGKYNEQSINIEYYLDNKAISDSEIFKNKLIDNGISYIFEEINKSKNNKKDKTYNKYKKDKKGKKSKKSKKYNNDKIDENKINENDEKDKNEIEFIEFDFDNKNKKNSPIIIQKNKKETKIIQPDNDYAIFNQNENKGDIKMNANKNSSDLNDENNAETEPNNNPKKIIYNKKPSDLNNIFVTQNPPGIDSQNKNGKKQRKSKAQDLKDQIQKNPEDEDNYFIEPKKFDISEAQQVGKDSTNNNQEEVKTNLGDFVDIVSNNGAIIYELNKMRSFYFFIVME